MTRTKDSIMGGTQRSIKAKHQTQSLQKLSFRPESGKPHLQSVEQSLGPRKQAESALMSPGPGPRRQRPQTAYKSAQGRKSVTRPDSAFQTSQMSFRRPHPFSPSQTRPLTGRRPVRPQTAASRSAANNSNFKVKVAHDLMSHCESAIGLNAKTPNSVVVSLNDIPTQQRKRLEFFARKSVSEFVVTNDLEAEYHV